MFRILFTIIVYTFLMPLAGTTGFYFLVSLLAFLGGEGILITNNLITEFLVVALCCYIFSRSLSRLLEINRALKQLSKKD